MLTTLIYAAVGGAFFYFINPKESLKRSAHIQTKKHLSIKIAQLQTSVKRQEVKQTQQKKRKKIQSEKKKIIEPIPKVKKVLVHKKLPPLKKDKIQEQLACKEENKQEKKELQESQKEKEKQEAQSKISQIVEDEKEVKRREFIAQLLEKINSNKSYPNSARRRGLEGEVDIRFTLLEDGNVKNIEILSGKSIFKKATIQAIQNSLPISVDDSLFDFPKGFKLKVTYSLKQS